MRQALLKRCCELWGYFTTPLLALQDKRKATENTKKNKPRHLDGFKGVWMKLSCYNA